MQPREFHYTDDASNKFWRITLEGSTHSVQYGPRGAKGQTQAKTFPNEDEARQSHDKLVAEKLKKGYVEVTTSQTSSRAVIPSGDTPSETSAHAGQASTPGESAIVVEQTQPPAHPASCTRTITLD